MSEIYGDQEFAAQEWLVGQGYSREALMAMDDMALLSVYFYEKDQQGKKG
jgi:hypothetical protein